MSDKVSALTAIVRRNPQHSVSYLLNLIGMAKKKNRKLAELAIESLKELFCDGDEAMLSNDKKLYAFSKNPLTQGGSIGPKELVQAYFEH